MLKWTTVIFPACLLSYNPNPLTAIAEYLSAQFPHVHTDHNISASGSPLIAYLYSMRVVEALTWNSQESAAVMTGARAYPLSTRGYMD